MALNPWANCGRMMIAKLSLWRRFDVVPVLPTLAPASISGQMEDEIRQAAANKLKTVAV
jgi:hypothetical protein